MRAAFFTLTTAITATTAMNPASSRPICMSMLHASTTPITAANGTGRIIWMLMLSAV